MGASHAQYTLITLTSVRVPLCHVQAKQGHGYPIQKLEECLSSLDKVATAMALNEKELKRAGSHGKAGSSTHFLAPLKPGCLCIYVRVRVRVRVLVLVRTPCLCSLCCFCTKTQTQTPIYSGQTWHGQRRLRYRQTWTQPHMLMLFLYPCLPAILVSLRLDVLCKVDSHSLMHSAVGWSRIHWYTDTFCGLILDAGPSQHALDGKNGAQVRLRMHVSHTIQPTASTSWICCCKFF
jgi:hypothetical protein